MERGQNDINFLDILKPISSSNDGQQYYIIDDHETFDEDAYKRGDIQLTYTDIDVNRAGLQEIVYTAIDKWGASSTATRQVLVTGSSNLDKTNIQVYTQNITNDTDNQTLGLTITFDYISKMINVVKEPNVTQLNPNNKDMQFRLRIYSKEGDLKKNFMVKGTDELTPHLLANIDGYHYSEGDQISLSTANLESVKVTAPKVNNITSETNDSSSETESNLITHVFTQNQIINGRLVLNADSLGYVYNDAPVIKWNQPDASTFMMTVPRGSTIDYTQYVTVEDTIDQSLNKTPIIKATQIDTTELGNKIVKYQVTDSWGRSSAIIINVDVVEKNELEKSNFVFWDVLSGNRILEVTFDDISKHLVASFWNVNGIEEEREELFTLTLYNKDGILKREFIINKNMTLEQLNNEFKEVTYENTDMVRIGINSMEFNVMFSNYKEYQKDPENSSSVFSTGTFNSKDEIENTRFVLDENKLILIYNKENPTIKYQDSENSLPPMYFLKDSSSVSEEQFYENIKIVDYLYGELNSDKNNTQITLSNNSENLEWSQMIQTVGTYQLSYTFTDTWGRTTTMKRNLFVVSKSSENLISFKADGNAFLTLKFDSTKDGFDVQVPPFNSDSTTVVPQTEESNPDTPAETTLYRLGIYDSNGKVLKEFELSSQDMIRTGADESSKLQMMYEELKKMEVRTGYYISVWVSDTNNLEIAGHITESSQYPIENESDEQDVMNNTRFKITDLGLEAIYNKAPEVTFDSWNALLAGTEIPLSQGVTVSDDHDTGTSYDDYKVSIQYQFIANSDSSEAPTSDDQSCSGPSEDPYCLRIGENKIIYTVTDSWGRSVTKERDLTIKNGLSRNIINLSPLATTNETPGREHALQLGFDSVQKKIRIEIDPNAKIYTADFKIGLQFILYSASGEIKFNHTRKGEQLLNYLEVINNHPFDYGDYLYIKAAQPRYVSIMGNVLDAREDYTDGFINPLNLTSAYFKITESGLQAYYKESQSVTVAKGDTVIAPVAPEEIPVQFKISPNQSGGGTIVIQNGTTNTMWYSEGSKNVFEMHIYRQGENGEYTAVRQLTDVTGRTQGQSIQWDDFEYRDGDYLVLWHKYPHMLTLYGNTYDTQENHIDLTNGIEQTQPRDIVFKLQNGQVIAEYNYAPEITGLGDSIDILESQLDDFIKNHGFTSKMSITDDRDENVLDNDRSKYVTIKPIEASTSRETTSSPLGAHRVRYTVTDTWGRSRSYEVTINVRTDVSNNYFNIKSYDNNDEVLFKLGFDSITNKYVVFDQVQNQFSTQSTLAQEQVLKIEITGSDGQQKALITLVGSDRGTSSKLDQLKHLNYAENDRIRIDALKFTTESTLTNGIGYNIHGNVSFPQKERTIQVLPDGITALELVKNIGYFVHDEGLSAHYNQAPRILVNSQQGAEELHYQVYRGTTYDFSILTATDPEDSDLTT